MNNCMYMVRMAAAQLAQIKKLEAELELLLNEPVLEEIRVENQKLIYQINSLKKAIDEEKSNIVPPKGIHSLLRVIPKALVFFIAYFSQIQATSDDISR